MTNFVVRYLLSFCMGLKLIFHINPNNFDHKNRYFPSCKYCDSFMNQKWFLFIFPTKKIYCTCMRIIFSITMVNSSWYLSQNLSIENKHEFETLLCQVRIVKRCEKQLKEKADRIRDFRERMEVKK